MRVIPGHPTGCEVHIRAADREGARRRLAILANLNRTDGGVADRCCDREVVLPVWQDAANDLSAGAW